MSSTPQSRLYIMAALRLLRSLEIGVAVDGEAGGEETAGSAAPGSSFPWAACVRTAGMTMLLATNPVSNSVLMNGMDCLNIPSSFYSSGAGSHLLVCRGLYRLTPPVFQRRSACI